MLMNTPDYAALSASDNAGEPVRATVQSPRSVGSTSITVNATTNWPAGTFIATTGTLLSTGKLDPTTTQVFYGTASGTTITITGFASGYTDKGSAINDVVVIKPTTEWANIVAQGVQSVEQFPANFNNFVESTGGVWSVSSGLVGSATAGNVWYNGTRSAMAAVTSKTFTASKDTYVDYNPSTTVWTYVVETTGAAEPAVTAGCVRVALAAAGASTVVFSQGAYNTLVKSSQLSNPYKFSYYASATQALTANTPLKVQFNIRNFDTGSNYDPTTNFRFTAPVAGFYFITTQVCIGSSGIASGAGALCVLDKNGAEARRSQTIQGSGTGSVIPIPTISDLFQLAAGDYIEVSAQTSDTSRSTGNGQNFTFFSGFLVSET